jgi:hypothetical protein
MSTKILTEAELSVIERINSLRTPGQWKMWGNEVLADVGGDSDVDTAEPVCSCAGQKIFNAHFIAQATEFIPRLIETVRAQSVHLEPFASMVVAELRRARSLFPPFHSPHEGIAVIREEFLELEREVFKGGSEPRSASRMQQEAIQLAAMALRFAQDCCGEAAKVGALKVEK